MVTFPYKLKILDRDENHKQTINTTCSLFHAPISLRFGPEKRSGGIGLIHKYRMVLFKMIDKLKLKV